MASILEELVHKKSAEDIETFLNSLDTESLKGIFLSAEDCGKLYDVEKSTIYFSNLPKEIQNILSKQGINLYELLQSLGSDVGSKLLFVILNSEDKECIGFSSGDITQLLEMFFDNPLTFLSNEDDFVKINVILKEVVSDDLFDVALLSHTNRQIITMLFLNNIKKKGGGIQDIFEFCVNLLLSVDMIISFVYSRYMQDSYPRKGKKITKAIDHIDDALKELTALRDDKAIKDAIDDFDTKGYCETYHMNNAYTFSKGDFNIINNFYSTNIGVITKIKDALVEGDMEAIKDLIDTVSDTIDEIRKHTREESSVEEDTDQEEEKPKKTTGKKQESIRSKLKRQ